MMVKYLPESGFDAMNVVDKKSDDAHLNWLSPEIVII